MTMPSVAHNWTQKIYYYFHFAWVGLRYAVGFELGQSMQALASTPRPPRVAAIARALAVCVLSALYFAAEVVVFGHVNTITWKITLIAFIISITACGLQAFLGAAQGFSPIWRRVVEKAGSGGPPAIAAGTAVGLYSLSSSSGTDFLVLYMALAAIPAWLASGAFSESHRDAAVDTRLKAQRVKNAVRACLLVFVAVTVIGLIGSMDGYTPPSEYVPISLLVGAIGATTVVVFGLSSTYLVTPAADLDQPDPRIGLRRDRRAALVILVGTLLMTAFLSGALSVLRLVVIVLSLLLFAASSRWPAYVAARILLWLHRALPWRVTEFLADAHDRGVLRRTGSVYQFRHVRIKDSLARSGIR